MRALLDGCDAPQNQPRGFHTLGRDAGDWSVNIHGELDREGVERPCRASVVICERRSPGAPYGATMRREMPVNNGRMLVSFRRAVRHVMDVLDRGHQKGLK